MNVAVVIQLAVATALPPLVSAALVVIDGKYCFSKKDYWLWQLVVGVVFGCVAIFGTEYGIHTIDATMNVRDAAPLVAGLVFGGPAGIIAGIIGGVERWFAAYWGRGMFTRLACSLATVLSGMYAADVRRSILVDDKPNVSVGVAAGFVDEVLHLALVLLTNMDSPQYAFVIVKACALPMILCVGISTGLSTWISSYLRGARMSHNREDVRVTWRIQNGVLRSVLVAFALTTVFGLVFHTQMAEDSTRSLLANTLSDVQSDISDAAQNKMKETVSAAVTAIPSVNDATAENLGNAQKYLGLSEVFVLNEDNLIIASSYDGSVGRDISKDKILSSMVDRLSRSWQADEIVTGRSADLFDRSRQYGVSRIEGGYLVTSYGAEAFREQLYDDVKRSTYNRRIGESGFLITADNSDSLVTNLTGSSSSQSARIASQQQLLKSVLQEQMGTLVETDFMDEPCYAMGGEVEGYRVVAVFPLGEAMLARDESVIIGSFTQILVYAMLYVSIFYLMDRDVVSCLQRVVLRLGQITDGDLDQVIDERSSLEFTQLSDGINMTVDALKLHIAEEAARIDQDLEYARAIQTSALPSIFPPYPNRHELDIYASMVPAKLVGGDFYDFFLLDNAHLAFLVADVSGKSVPGAMFMMRAKTLVRTIADQGFAPDEVFNHTNTALCEGNASSMFVTAWLGFLDLATGHIQAVNAGHNPPYVLRKNGACTKLNLGHNLILGCSEKASYDLLEFDLEPGDALFLYTDGVVEAYDEEGDSFGETRLRKCLAESAPEASAQQICMDLSEHLDAFVGDESQYDDITMLAVRYLGAEDQGGFTDGVQVAEGGDMLETQALTHNVDLITSFVEKHLDHLGCSDRTRIQIDIAMDEIFANICDYAYGDAGYRPTWVRFESLEDGHTIRVTFEDEGRPFDPLSIDAPDTTLSLDERGIGGYGIFIVRQTMDNVVYERRGTRNRLSFTKAIN